MTKYQVIIQKADNLKTVYINAYANAYTALRRFYQAKRNKTNLAVRFCVIKCNKKG